MEFNLHCKTVCNFLSTQAVVSKDKSVQKTLSDQSIILPTDHSSARAPYSCMITSGAMNTGVPDLDLRKPSSGQCLHQQMVSTPSELGLLFPAVTAEYRLGGQVHTCLVHL